MTAQEPQNGASVGYRQVRLGDVLRLRKEVVHPRNNPRGLSTFVGLEHIESGTGRRIGSLPVNMADLTGRKPRFQRGDIVYGYLRPYLNKIWIADFDGLCSVDQYVYSVESSVADPEFIAWFMRSPAYLEAAPVDATPGQLPRIRTEEVAATKVALPPIAEQILIASRLNEQLAEVDRARAAVEAQLTATEAFPDAILRGTFCTSKAVRWSRQRLSDVLRKPLRTGLSRQTSDNSPTRCLTLASVRNGKLDLSASKPMDANEREVAGNKVQPGAFYVVRGNGNLSLVARGALAPDEVPPSILYPDLLIEVSPDPSRMRAAFLRWAWDAPETRHALESRSMTSAGIYKINLSNLSTVELPVPPIVEQDAIAERLATEFEGLQSLRKALRERLAGIEKLPAAILREAFSGRI